MPFPIIPAIMLAGLGMSLGSSLYKQENNRQLWSRQAGAYDRLDKGYREYLAKQGRSINPDRAWTSYYGTAERLRNNIENSYADSVGAIGRSAGMGAAFSKKALFEVGKTYRRWL